MVNSKSVLLAAILLSLALPPQQAKAQASAIPVYDTGAAGGLAATSSSVLAGAGAQIKAAGQITDVASQNARNNAKASVAAPINAAGAMPDDHCLCNDAQSAADAVLNKDQVRTLTQAMAISQGARVASPQIRAQELKERCLLFAPADPKNPEYSVYQGICKGLTMGASAKWAGAEMSIESVLGSLQMEVPKGALQLEPGVYTVPVVTPANDSQYKFMAALTFCQLITPARPQLMQSATDSGGNAVATVAATGMASVASASAASSVAAGTCYKLLAERAAFPPTVNLGATAAITGATAVPGTYDLQLQRCKDDFADKIIDQTALTNCTSGNPGLTTGGRSDLQADYDQVNWITSFQHMAKPVGALEYPDRQRMVAMAWSEMQRFQERELEERRALTEAIGIGNSIPQPSTTTPVLIH